VLKLLALAPETKEIVSSCKDILSRLPTKSITLSGSKAITLAFPIVATVNVPC